MRSNPTKTLLLVLALGIVTGGLIGCGEDGNDWRDYLEFGIPAKGDQTFGELNPVDDMHDQPAIKSQEEEMLMPAPRTIPQDFRRYPEAIAADKTLASALVNPVPITQHSLKRGQDLYMTMCVACHGERGLGNGTIIPKFSKPPALTSKKLRQEWTDGDFYHVISHGQNIMPSYANQLLPMERWAVVNYVRALQRAEFPKPADVERAQKLPAPAPAP